MKTQKFARRPFYIDAVQVTEENIAEVAAWCQGEVRTQLSKTEKDSERYVKVRVHRPLNERQTRAFVGDWVLYAGTGYKVYTPKAFENSFVSADEPTSVTFSFPVDEEKVVDPPQELRVIDGPIRVESLSLDVPRDCEFG